jgi:glycosyltransferase involved in cell wall biosynthesis
MRISLLTVDLVVNGGGPKQLLYLAKWLQEFGHQVTVYSYRYNPSRCYPNLTSSLDIRCVERLRPDWRQDKGHVPSHSLLRGAKRQFCESWGLSRLIEDPGDLLNPHDRIAARVAVQWKRKTGAPVVWMCNDAANWEQPGYRPTLPSPVQGLKDRVLGYLDKRAGREFDDVVVLDHRVKQIIEDFYGYPARVIRSGLDLTAFSEREEGRWRIRGRHRIPKNSFLVLWFGILEPRRRIEDVLEAMRALRQERGDIQFLIVGLDAQAPEYARQLRQFVSERCLESAVCFALGSVPEEEVADYYSAGDVLVYPCENYAWGLSVFEAMACGIPVIVSRGCGAHEVLEDGETALLVPPRDPQEILHAVTALADRPDLRRKISLRGQQYVQRHMSWERYAREMLEVFEQASRNAEAADNTRQTLLDPAKNGYAARP